jgi:hypothetical protein
MPTGPTGLPLRNSSNYCAVSFNDRCITVSHTHTDCVYGFLLYLSIVCYCLIKREEFRSSEIGTVSKRRKNLAGDTGHIPEHLKTQKYRCENL